MSVRLNRCRPFRLAVSQLTNRDSVSTSHSTGPILSPCASLTELANRRFAAISSLRLLTGSGRLLPYLPVVPDLTPTRRTLMTALG